jgi:hypothetical protein
MDSVRLNLTPLLSAQLARVVGTTAVTLEGRCSVCDQCPQYQEDEEVRTCLKQW